MNARPREFKRMLSKSIVLLMLLPTVIALNIVCVECEPSDLTPTLIAPTWGNFNQTYLEIYDWQGVDYVVFYGGHDTIENINHAHSLGIKSLIYVTALQEDGGAGPFHDSWLQYDGAHYIKPPDFDYYRLSPYGPYIDNVLIPRVEEALNKGADGIFTDAVLLHPECDKNPSYGWPSVHPELSFEEFRHLAGHDVLERVYQKVKEMNPDAVLIVNNNNIFSQADRDKYASYTEEWQDVSDGFLLEIVGTDPYGDKVSTINTLVSNERDQFGVTKPIWVLYHTEVDNRFEYILDNAYSNDFGYWAYYEYLASPGLIIYNRTPYHYQISSNSTIDNMRFDTDKRLLNFTVEGKIGTRGRTEVVLPRAFLDGEPMVMLDDELIESTYSSNETHYSIQFNYMHSTKSVTVGGSNTIPEFSNIAFILPTIILLSILFLRLRTESLTSLNKRARAL